MDRPWSPAGHPVDAAGRPWGRVDPVGHRQDPVDRLLFMP